jgi:hypothetical protein
MEGEDPREPVQLQLPFGVKHQVNPTAGFNRKTPSGRLKGLERLREPLRTGLGFKVQPERAITGDWTRILGVRTAAGAKPASRG